MNTEFLLALPISELPYRSMLYDVIDHQRANDFDPIKDVGENRFSLGFTSYFAPDIQLSDCREVCKAILPEIYDWLMEHAPDAMVEMDHWQIDYDPAFDAGDEPGEATVWVNFGEDHTRAVYFKLRFV